MNKERIFISVASAIVLIVIAIPIWWTTIHDIDQNLDNAVRMIPKEAIGVAGMVEAQFMLVRQDIWLQPAKSA